MSTVDRTSFPVFTTLYYSYAFLVHSTVRTVQSSHCVSNVMMCLKCRGWELVQSHLLQWSLAT